MELFRKEKCKHQSFISRFITQSTIEREKAFRALKIYFKKFFSLPIFYYQQILYTVFILHVGDQWPYIALQYYALESCLVYLFYVELAFSILAPLLLRARTP